MDYNPVKLRHIGVNLKKPGEEVPLVPGADFPRGIAGLDVPWFENRIVNLERIIGCDTDEKLRALREEAIQCRELKRLKEMAEKG